MTDSEKIIELELKIEILNNKVNNLTDCFYNMAKTMSDQSFETANQIDKMLNDNGYL